ncbi:IQ calmodulin-binding motif [Popillia japonica]|uniref:Dynein regulatory complex protein 9 n=1 Tax=Popillia japonica TaxID=7064 RepID=A0AAW1N784_POPJA
MLDADAFKVRSVHIQEWHENAYEHIIDDLAKDYAMTSIGKQNSSFVSPSLQVSVQQTKQELYFMARAPCIILNECIDKLIVLRTIMSEKIDARWYNKVVYRPPHHRFASDECADEFDIYDYTNKRKQAKIVSLIHNTLSNVLVNIEHHKSIDNLMDTVETFEREDADALQLLADFNENVLKFLTVSRQIKDSHDKNRHIYHNKVRKRSEMETKYEDLVIYCDIKRRYVHKWENNRCYLHNFQQDSITNDLRSIIDEYNNKIMLENRIHHETCSYFDGTYDSTEKDIEMWLGKYDEDLERIEGDIFEVRMGLERCENEFKSLKEEYESRSREMETWMQFKEEMRLKMEYELKLAAAATKIQAFWRGCMVRHHLGPYSKKKKGKGKGKDKKKGKKKKK